jgi:hypothetical protein
MGQGSKDHVFDTRADRSIHDILGDVELGGLRAGLPSVFLMRIIS